jgi:hypothetical protein
VKDEVFFVPNRPFALKIFMLRHWLTLDSRALVCFRVGLGFVLIANLLDRMRNLSAHYTDPSAISYVDVSQWNGYWGPSLHSLSGGFWFQTLLMGLGLLIGLFMAKGYRPRLCSLLGYLFLVSIHHRNFIIEDSGDTYLRLLYFWSIFLPLERSWKDGPVYCGWGAAGYQIQLISVYLYAALLKCASPVWQRGDGLAYALKFEYLCQPMATLLRPQTSLCTGLSYLSIGLELLIPLLLLIPAYRWLGAGLIVCLHLGFGVFLHLGIFVAIGCVAPLALLPGSLLDRIRGPLRAEVRPNCPSWIRVAAIPTVLLAWLNLATLIPIPVPFARATQLLGLMQNWGVFTDEDPQSGWMIAQATLADGSKVDLLRGGQPLDLTYPKQVLPVYRDIRWRNFLSRIYSKDCAVFRKPYAVYLVQDWNLGHPDRPVVNFQLLYLQRSEPQVMILLDSR